MNVNDVFGLRLRVGVWKSEGGLLKNARGGPLDKILN